MPHVTPLFCDELPESIQDDWQRLLALSNAPGFEWDFEIVRTWTAELRGAWKPLLLVVSEGEEVIGIFPLMYRRQMWKGLVPQRCIRFLAHGSTDFASPLAAPEHIEAVVDASISWLFSTEIRWELMTLDNIEGSDPAVGSLRRAFARWNCPFDVVEGKYYYMNLERPWEEVWSSTSKKFVRNKLNNATNRITRAGEWKFLDNPNFSLDEILDKARLIHQVRQSRAERGSKYSEESYARFVRQKLRVNEERGRLRTHWLQLNGTCIAYKICFVQDNVIYGWQTAFLPEYAEFSPSRILLGHLVRRAHELGLRSVHFMRGEEEYKTKWTSDYTGNLRFVARRTDHWYGAALDTLNRRYSGASRAPGKVSDQGRLSPGD